MTDNPLAPAMKAAHDAAFPGFFPAELDDLGKTDSQRRAITAIEAATPLIREMVATELEVFANRIQANSERPEVTSQLTTCSNEHNASLVEAYRQAANIARVGADYKNTNCNNCRDTRGGAPEHTTEQCTWNPKIFFGDRLGCIGRDLKHIGWVTPRGSLVTLDVEPDVIPKTWKKVYVNGWFA